MPCGNGQTVSKREHGVCFSKFGLACSLLCALCSIGTAGLSGGGPGCSPCPTNCTCPLLGPPDSCLVNCSSIGLDRVPEAADLPPGTKTLDLSKNRISSLDANLFDRLTSLEELYLQGNRITVLPRGIFGCGTLSILDLSSNQISTLEERICNNLFNLTEINLSANPLDCSCKLVRLVTRLQEQGVRVRRSEFTRCERPPEVRGRPVLNISLQTCGLNYAACLPNIYTGVGELVIFTRSTPGNFTRESCNALCFESGQRYGGLGAQHECLCSTNSEANHISESQCSAACTDSLVMQECGWTVALDVFPVNFSASLCQPPRFSVHSEASLSVISTVHLGALSWDFGDQTPWINNTEPSAKHKYALPGSYIARAMLRSGNKEETVSAKLRVALPPRLELRCPEFLVANHSLDIQLVNWGGLGVVVDWRILKDGNEVAKVAPHCPEDGLLHGDPPHCYQLLPEESSWSSARNQCTARKGDLAVVQTESLRSRLALYVTQERGVWLGLSDIDIPGSLRWVSGANALLAEGGTRTRALLVPGNVCVSLNSSGQVSSHPCSATRAFVCEFKPEVTVPNASILIAGTVVFHTHQSLSSKLVASPALETPSRGVELLLFPAMAFLQNGRLSSLEFITQDLSGDTQVRLQVYRPDCEGLHLLQPGCGELCAPIAVCQAQELNDVFQETCLPLQQWCGFKSHCLPLSSPCTPSSCPNCSSANALPLEATLPKYNLVHDYTFTLEAGEARHQLVQEQVADLEVSWGDFIALQHNSGPGGLLQCSTNHSSPWRQSFLALNHSNWFNDTINITEDATWIEEAMCPIRVLYTGMVDEHIPGQLLQRGLPDPGVYSFEVTSNDPDFPSQASCNISVVPPMALTVVYPPSQNGTIYFPINQTFLLARIRSWHEALASWQGGNQNFSFLPHCPPELESVVEECQSNPHNDTLFAYLEIPLGDSPPPVLVLIARSKVTSANVTVSVKVEVPLRGLKIVPHPNRRVLMNTLVSYMATVEEGSDPTFKWTVDDKPHFTYYNTVLNIIYQNDAVYKLSVTAQNHVSNLTEHYNVTVDQMKPMGELTVEGVPSIVTQGSNQTFSVSITMDISVEATIWWTFGDGDYRVYQYKPPYENSILFPDDSTNLITLKKNVTYIYSQPGEYTLIVSVFNQYQNKSQKIDVFVYSILTKVEIMTDSRPLLTGSPMIFEAHPLPSAYGIIYTWDFGDGSQLLQGRERRVQHTFSHWGIYNISVSINNTISHLANYTEVLVSEEIRGLTASSSAPTEFNTPTVIDACVETGNNITWIFDMGDGKVISSQESQVEHIYKKDGFYTVNITSTNAVSIQSVILQVQVFVLQVVWLDPSGCIQEVTNISFNAFVSGNFSIYTYEWSFGDGTPNFTVHGSPRVTHMFSTSGNYHLSLLLSSKVNKANFFAWVCVQPVVTNVSLVPGSKYTRLGEESTFVVSAFPEFEYTYLWDFGINESSVRGEKMMAFTYKNPGQYLVMVTVLNNISCSNNTALIEVQDAVGLVVIQHNGTKFNNLTLHQAYMFTASSGSSKVHYTWDFGDGNVLSGNNITHIYNCSGYFNISLIGNNEVSGNSTEITVAVIAPIQGLTINASLTKVPLNTSVDFEAHLEQGDDVRYSWILCDRCTPILSSHYHTHYTFKSVGTFNVIVTAENKISSMQASIFIFVQREVEGLQIVSEDLGDSCCFATNKVLHLQATVREGTNISFSWDLLKDQEAQQNLSGRAINVSFSRPGPCNVFLNARNLLGQISVNRTIEFLDIVGSLSLSVKPNPVALNNSTSMTVSVTSGSNLRYLWHVDNLTINRSVPFLDHQFDNPGLKLVQVEVSNDVSLQNVSVWITVQEPVSGVTFLATDVTEQNFVMSGTTVSFQGVCQTGTNVSWTWYFPESTEMEQNVTHNFSTIGVFRITLNAANNVSAEAVSRDFTVQDKIKGLELKVSKGSVAPRESVEFKISITSGTSVSFVLSISGDSTVVLTNHTYVHQFTRVDDYVVNLTAHNQISSERVSTVVNVMEPISRLTMVNCCEAAIPVGIPKHFSAEIQTGDRVTILWTFDLHHGTKQAVIGPDVTYTPNESGLLTIYLCAVNSLGSHNVTKDIQVQNILTSVRLEAQPQNTFINKSVSFRASVYPQFTPATFQWNFGDGTALQTSNSLSITHLFSMPGTYVVHANASNLLSWVMGQVTVAIQVLMCEEPTVQLSHAQRLVIRRSQPNLLEASVDLKGCVRYRMEYLWEIFSTPACVNPPKHAKILLPAEVDVTKLQLSIPKMALQPGNYSTVFSLSYLGIPLRKTVCLQLSVVAGKLVPIIEGGNFRVWSKTQDLQLSAEQSYDPNLEPENQSLLTYLWECLKTSKGPGHCSSLNFGLGSNGPVLGIPGSELEANVTYTFRLTISKEGMSPESTNQTVLVHSGRIPMVSLDCVSCKAKSMYEVSQSSYVYLAGTCSNCEASHRGYWTVKTLKNESLVLNMSTTSTGSDGMNLVLRQGALRDGISYIFSLHVSDAAMDGEGVASIVLRPNLPPAGGSCSLQPDVPRLQSLVDKLHFTCTGYTDSDDSDAPLLYSLLVTRCSFLDCEDFCVYKGTSSEHASYLPPGFHASNYRVNVSLVVEDDQGAAIMALNQTLEVVLPDVPTGYDSLAQWLHHLSSTTLWDLLRQGDPQRVRELCLALITVLNEYETRSGMEVTKAERLYRVAVRSNITRALTSLDLNTVNDIQQTSAALAQCTAVSREFICEECQNSTLNKLESMLEILQSDTKQGTVTPTEIADNILNIMGGLIHLVSQAPPPMPESEDRLPMLSDHYPLRVAARAYNLSSELMRILMHSRVLNEEPLVLRGTEIYAAGKRADPKSLLCYNQSVVCPFSIPHAFAFTLGGQARVIQLLVQVKSNPFPFNFVSNYSVSTKVASMEFQTENGTHIPIVSLDQGQAITVTVANSSDDPTPKKLMTVATNISACDSIIAWVRTNNTNNQAGLHIQIFFSPLDGGDDFTGENLTIMAYLHSHPRPNEHNCSQHKTISLNMFMETDHQPYTFFLSPHLYDTTQDYYVNVTTGCGAEAGGVLLEVAVFSSLCQYFSESEKVWRTDGMLPLAETTADHAVCSTSHLTSFAASLFAPQDAVTFILPDPPGKPNMVVLLTCLVGLLCYSVAAVILHRLDQLDLRRAAVVPLCGKEGLFKYEVQVKTGWGHGAGTTAHVGISLYGREGRSGHRHLDCSGAFTRNSLDIFQISTDSSLGNLWKIRIWHDNKGLSPAWMLQYVLVKDLQNGNGYYFLVEEWLSVDNDRTDGRVEIEVEAASEANLHHLPRRLTWELQRAVSDGHIWLSLFDRPLRSPFTRLQRATCCTLLVHLILLANAVWYTLVTNRNLSDRKWSFITMSQQTTGHGEALLIGLESCLAVYPLYLLVLWVFRAARGKVVLKQVPPQVDQASLEIDDFLDNSLVGSSFLILNGLPGETYSEETNVDLPTLSSKSLHRWGLQERERMCHWSELIGSPAVVGEALPKLKRGQGSRHLGVDMALVPEEEEEAGGYVHRNKYFTSSDEDLIKRILADGQLQVSRLCEPQQFFAQTDSEMADLSSIFGDKTEVILLQKMNEPLPPGVVRREPPKTAFTSPFTITDVCRHQRLPAWCGRAALLGSWAALALSGGLATWLGLSFSDQVALMWVITVMGSLLASSLILEPLKVLVEGLYYALVVRRLRPEEHDILMESPRVEPVSQRIPRVRPPQGFALFQAREEARKVRVLHSTLKNFVFYMLFLLVVLLLTYGNSGRDTLRPQLRTQLELRLHTAELARISRPENVWTWLSDSLLPYLHNAKTLMYESGSVLLGAPRLRQIRSLSACPPAGCGNNTLGLGGAGQALGPNGTWVWSTADDVGVWHWGHMSTYTGGGYVQGLRTSLEESKAVVDLLQAQQWLDPLSQALFVEFSLYNTNTDLLAVVIFLLEFPVQQGALSSLDVQTCHIQGLRSGLTLPLLLTAFLLLFVLYFCIHQCAVVRREGRSYFLRPWNVVGLCSLSLCLAAVALQLSRAALSDRLWDSFRQRRGAYTNFYSLAFQNQAFTQVCSLLLFVLVLKASHQLRFLREWTVFGRTLQRSAWELLAMAMVFLVLLLAYAHAGHLLFHSSQEGLDGVATACLSLLSMGYSLPPAHSADYLAYCWSFAVLRLGLLWLLVSALLRGYRHARSELYRPAVEPQAYEMVDLFLRRLKMWMGLSRAKEFRHKVRFEGMDLPPSRSSSTSDCKSLCLPPPDTPEAPPTPDSVDANSEASWQAVSCSPCSLGEGGAGVPGGAAWRERAEVEATLRRLLPAFDALLQQLDRVTRATEELYRVECQLERAQRQSYTRKRNQNRDQGADRKRDRSSRQQSRRDSAGRKSHGKGCHKSRLSEAGPNSCRPNPNLDPASSTPRREWENQAEGEIAPSSLFRHPAHTTTIPTRKRRPTPLKNKVHPNKDVHVSGHPRP
ncbi:polycystin-1 isoform X2 [Brienomyrus brachyistius]|uniref:polycystin-1 isoform X2 n=1 Tax=Brienomyrus brachyistius TaxID=42636 RepID=UPI0020B3AB8B|nr:polycystin-1 isoform X2 [Brienomyrus brachyistius]